MIGRIWHGYTTPGNADAYENVLLGKVLPDIEAMEIPGLRGIDVLRRPTGDEVEFITLMWFESLASVKAFVGEEYRVAHVPPEAREVLSRYDARSQHYEVVRER